MNTIAQEIQQETKIEIARQLLKFHDSVTIAEITGLSIRQAQPLVDEQDKEMQDGDD